MMVMQPLYGSIFAVVYSNSLISKVLTFSSLHNEPEPRPSQKGWSGSDCYVAIFVICDFFVNFRGFGCFLAFQLGSYMKASFLANIDSNNYILVVDCKLWVQNSPFRGLVYRGIFFQSLIFHKGLAVLA